MILQPSVVCSAEKQHLVCKYAVPVVLTEEHQVMSQEWECSQNQFGESGIGPSLLPLLPDPHSTWPLTGGGSTGALVEPHGQRPSHWALTDSERGGIVRDCSPLNHSYSGSSSRACFLWETYQDNRLRKQNSWEPMGTQTMIRWRFAVQVCDYNAS